MERNQHATQSPSATLSKRYNIYSNIHKALRAYMCNMVTAVAGMDGNDQQEVAATLMQLRTLAAFCAGHFKHEDDYVHTAMEARRPGSSSASAGDHEHHKWAIEELRSFIDTVQQTGGAERDAAINKLRSYLALFVAENFVHMNVEETENNAMLWATHTDAELMGIEHAIVASLAPEETAISMRWMLPALNHSERVQLLSNVREHAPAPAFEGMLAIARAHLGEYDWSKLARSLALPNRLAA